MCDLSVPQGPEGRPPNVSPARTLLPRGAGWRIALYAVFRKENRTRDPLQRGQGGKQGAGLGDRYKTLRRRRRRATPSIRKRVWHPKVPHLRCSDLGESMSQPCRAGLTFGRPALRALFNGSAVLVMNPGIGSTWLVDHRFVHTNYLDRLDGMPM